MPRPRNLTRQQERVLSILRLAGDDGVLGSHFYSVYLPTFSQRIGELRNKGYTIRCRPEAYADGATGRRYWLEAEPVDETVVQSQAPAPVEQLFKPSMGDYRPDAA